MAEDEQGKRSVMPEYLAPQDDAELRKRENDRRSAGAILTAGTVLGLVFVWIISAIRIHPGPRGSVSVQSQYMWPVVLTLTAVFVIGGIGFWYWKREGSKAFLIGTVIGLGIGMLIEGICFTALMRR